MVTRKTIWVVALMAIFTAHTHGQDMHGEHAAFRVQVGAFRVPANAQGYFTRLNSAGFSPVLERHGDLYRVIVPAMALEEVEGIVQRLGNTGSDGTWAHTANKLVVWSFTDEIENMIAMHNVEKALGMEIAYSLTPVDHFPYRLSPALMAGGAVAPDVFALDSAFVRPFIESGLLLDLTNLYNEVQGRVLRYPVEVATYNGRVYGMSWQAIPGAMFFRRSLAIRYLGTDDPTVIQRYFANWATFLDTARNIGTQSGGGTMVVSSIGDLDFPFRASRAQPWVVNGRLHIDPVMIE